MRDPVRGIDFLQRGLAQGINTDEELLDSSEEDRRLGAPAVRIAVDVILTAKQVTLLGKDPDHLLVAFKDILSDERGNAALLGELAVVVDGRKELQTHLAAELVIVVTVTRRDMNASAAGLEGDELCRVNGRRAVEEGMAGLHSLESRTLAGLSMLGKFQTGLLTESLGTAGGHDQSLGGVFQQDVVELSMDRDRQIRGKSPRGRGPDDDRERLVIG